MRGCGRPICWKEHKLLSGRRRWRRRQRELSTVSGGGPIFFDLRPQRVPDPECNTTGLRPMIFPVVRWRYRRTGCIGCTHLPFSYLWQLHLRHRSSHSVKQEWRARHERGVHPSSGSSWSLVTTFRSTAQHRRSHQLQRAHVVDLLRGPVALRAPRGTCAAHARSDSAHGASPRERRNPVERTDLGGRIGRISA